jgi:hypothetical protein
MEGYEDYVLHTLVYKTEMPFFELNEEFYDEKDDDDGSKYVLKYKEIGLLPDNWIFPPYQNLLNNYTYLPGLELRMPKNKVINLLWNYHRYINKENTTVYDNNTDRIFLRKNNTQYQSSREDRQPFAPIGGAMKNQEVKKCEKKKVVLGKERCIYKVSGSKKDYMKYKGKIVPVTDYVKYMKKKN